MSRCFSHALTARDRSRRFATTFDSALLCLTVPDCARQHLPVSGSFVFSLVLLCAFQWAVVASCG
eukprot:6550519-Alexandrium_andersonii.AAC.1